MKKLFLLILTCMLISCGSATIHHHVRAGRTKEIKKYISSGKDLNKKCEKSDFQKSDTISTNLYKGDSLLGTAIRSNKYEIVKMLIETGADYREKEKYNKKSYLFMANRSMDPRIIKLLIEKGLDVNHMDKLGHTALLEHINSGNAATVKLLLQGGAKPDMIDWKGWPYILRGALSAGDISVPIFKLMAKHGVKLTAKNKQDEQAIHYADPIEVAYLVMNGVKIDAEDTFGNTALHHRADDKNAKYYLQILSLLIDKGTNPNHKNKDGQTALHFAATRGTVQGVMQLIAKGADVNARDNNGNTALHYAYLHRRQKTIKTLLNVGANPRIRNKAGRYPNQMRKNDRRYYRR